MTKNIIVLEARPNTLATFDNIMLLAHTLKEKTGFDYNIQSDFKNDCVKLIKVVRQ